MAKDLADKLYVEVMLPVCLVILTTILTFLTLQEINVSVRVGFPDTKNNKLFNLSLIRTVNFESNRRFKELKMEHTGMQSGFMINLGVKVRVDQMPLL